MNFELYMYSVRTPRNEARNIGGREFGLNYFARKRRAYNGESQK